MRWASTAYDSPFLSTLLDVAAGAQSTLSAITALRARPQGSYGVGPSLGASCCPHLPGGWRIPYPANVALSQMNLDIPGADARQIEVLANGLPLWHGSQLAVDTTLVSPLGRDGSVRGRADTVPGCSVEEAARRKRRQVYPEFADSRRCRLVVFGLEVGGRWADEAASFIHQLARARARSVPAWAQAAATATWCQRWSALAAFAAHRALAASLLEQPLSGEDALDGEPPDLSAVLADARWEEAADPSRLPPRWAGGKRCGKKKKP